jgi:hypothetical protein
MEVVEENGQSTVNEWFHISHTERFAKQDVMERLIKQIMLHSDVYWNLHKITDNIDYNDPIARIAYLYVYIPLHTRLIQEALETWDRENNQAAVKLFNTNRSICCIGGGPGSDILGILRYIYNNCIQIPRLTFYIFDRMYHWQSEWVDIWNELDNTHTTMMYHLFDINVETNAVFDSFFDRFDIFTLIKFWSSIFTSHISKNNLKMILSWAKTGAYIIYVDYGHIMFTTSFITLMCTSGWSIVFRKHSEKEKLFNDEQISYFMEYHVFLGPRVLLFGPDIDVIVFQKI